MEIRNVALCAVEKKKKKNWQNKPSGSKIFSGEDFMSLNSLHLLIPKEKLTFLMVTSAFAIKENVTIRSQNRVAIVQTSKEITR